MGFFSSEILVNLLMLTFLEIILGIDNLIFIALAISGLPKKNRNIVKGFGLSLALIIRIIMLMTLSWIMTLTDPLFFIGDKGVSFKNFLLISGGLFLMVKSGWEIASDVIFDCKDDKESKKINANKNTLAAILQITLIDFIFSFDSVITGVGMTNNISIIVVAVIISMFVMLIASEKVSYFLQTYPSLKIIALAFIFMIGVILFADGLNFMISKGYLYFALFFTILVESLNIIARRHHKNK